MKTWITSLLSESGTLSNMRWMADMLVLYVGFLCISLVALIYIGGRDVTPIVTVIGLLSTIAFGGKVLQKKDEVKNDGPTT